MLERGIRLPPHIRRRRGRSLAKSRAWPGWNPGRRRLGWTGDRIRWTGTAADAGAGGRARYGDRLHLLGGVAGRTAEQRRADRPPWPDRARVRKGAYLRVRFARI